MLSVWQKALPNYRGCTTCKSNGVPSGSTGKQGALRRRLPQFPPLWQGPPETEGMRPTTGSTRPAAVSETELWSAGGWNRRKECICLLRIRPGGTSSNKMTDSADARTTRPTTCVCKYIEKRFCWPNAPSAGLPLRKGGGGGGPVPPTPHPQWC